MFNRYYWGEDADGNYSAGFENITSTHYCSSEELGFVEGRQGNFFPMIESQKNLAMAYQKKMLCIDPTEAYLKGDYNSDSASLLNIQFIKCHDRDDCLPDEQIMQFIKDKYIMIMYNSVRFDSRYYDAKSIIPESRISWLLINTQMRQTIPFKVTKTEVELQDLAIDLDQLTEFGSLTPFKLEK